MQCDQCQERDANVFLTQILEGRMSMTSLCEVCAAPFLRANAALANPPDSQEQLLEALGGFDSRYSPQAYSFTVRALRRASHSEPPGQHFSAAFVAEAFRELALAEFGAQALSTLAGWGVHSCEDVGAIVFALVGGHVFGNRPEERPEDFSGLYDFRAAFPTDV